MDALVYLLKHTYINMLKRLFKKPAAAILTVITILCMLGPTVLRLTTMSSTKRPELFEAIIGGGTLLYGFFLFSSIVAQNAGMFYLADVNLVFTSPIHRKKVLIYAMIGSLMGSILMSLFIIIMLPMVGGGGIYLFQYIAAGFSVILMMCMLFLLYFCFYLRGAKSGDGINPLKIVSKVFMILVALSLSATVIYVSGDFNKAIKMYFESYAYNLVPIFGWTKWAVVSALNGDILFWLAATGVSLLFSGIVIKAILNMEHEYYEQAMTDAYRIQEIRTKASSGNLDAQSFYTKKVRKAEIEFKDGAKAIWSRHVLEIKKSGIGKNNTGIIIGIVYVILFSLVFKLDYTAIVYMIILLNMSNSMNDAWNKEFKKHFIYLIPESSMSKAYYGTVTSLIKSIFAGIPSFVLLYILKRPPVIEIIVLYFVYTSFMPVFLYSAVFAQRIAGSRSNVLMVMMIRMLAVLLSAIPSSVVMAVIYIMTGTAFGGLLPLIMVAVNIATAILLLKVSSRIFEVAELMD
ncbi:MAG TPA: putative ABC exporter domain-containing protein [Pseudobacteroides sp.]|uniref:putative ABC exporter domain-containing protein n=1 Tax=Pseudobacteroides sp. TaxID=1968840 RepID=UPI002F94A337